MGSIDRIRSLARKYRGEEEDEELKITEKNKIDNQEEIIKKAQKDMSAISNSKKNNDSELKKPSYRTSNKLNIGIQDTPIVSPKESTVISQEEIKANDEAKQMNEDIEEGGYKKTNVIISNSMRSFLGGAKSATAGIGNAFMLPVANMMQKIDKLAQIKKEEKNEDTWLRKASDNILDKAEEISNTANYDSFRNSRIKNDAIQTAGTVSGAVGNMLPSIVSNVVVPGSGLAVIGTGAGGNSAQETLNSKRDNLDKAIATGVLKGATEVATEKITGGNFLSKGSLDDLAKKSISKIASKPLQKVLSKGYEYGGEVLEQQVSDIAGYIIDKVINNQELPDLKTFWDNANETTKNTLLTTAVLNLFGLGGSTHKEIDNYSNEEINKYIPQVEKILENNSEIIAKNLENKLPNQTTKYKNMDEILNNKELPMNNFQYEASKNAKINNIRQDANKFFNNTEKAHNFVNMLEKIITDKNITIRLDNNLKTTDGRIANGSYSNGVMTINPNSTRAGEFIAVHELTHAIGTNQMKSMINTYRKSNVEFNSAVENILQNYKSTEINEEALADISGQLFGTQEFINNVAQNNPNIFQKIYSEIKYLWHQFRGYKNQNQFVEDLYYKWTQAYNNNNKLNNSENYLITQSNKGKYVRADRQVITGNNPLKWETQVESYIDDNIRQGKDVQVTTENGDVLTITKDTSGKAKFRNQITDKYGNTRYLNNKEFLSKLTAETHIDELAQISQKINKNPIPDYKNHKFAKDGFDYRSAYFEDFDGQYYKITMSVGKNGDIDTIYNIGKMDKKNRSKSSLVAQRPSDKNITSNEEITSIESISSSNKDVNTTTKYSMQESENNSFSMQDNQGRTLTKEQQEYFKDSKVRDENGNLLEVYHGTEANSGIPKEYWFTIFDIDKSKISTMGDGFYFTDNYDRASSYAHSKGNVYKSYLNITNPFTLKNNMTFEETVKSINPNYNIDNLKMENRNKFDGTKLRKYLIDNGYDGISLSGTYVAFNSNQIKNVSNTKPTSNPDIRYSQNNKTWQSYLENNFNTKGTRTNLKDIKLPTAKKENSQTVNDGKKSIEGNYETATINRNIKANNDLVENWQKDTKNATQKDLPTAQQKSFSTQTLPVGEYTGKQRKHYKSIMESSETTPQAKKIAKELLNSDTYVPETNKGQLEQADNRIMLSTPDSELKSLNAKAINGEKITSIDIAVGERLIQYYSKTGDAIKLQEAIQSTAIAGTTAGQTVQALSLLNHQTPQGQAMWLQKSVDKMNNELAKRKGGKIHKDKNGDIVILNNKGIDITEKVDLFNLTPEMIQDIVSSRNDVELNDNLNRVYEQLGQQVTKTTLQKIDSWRYFAMLANPRTHVRNIIGNAAMGTMQYGVKNKIAGAIEGVVSKFNPGIERTHTIVNASTEVKQFAKEDINNVLDRLGLTENKYNPKNRLENSMRTFKSDAMEKTVGKLFELNDKALEAEDGWGLKAGYKKALADYMTANKLTPENITDKQLAKARNYAIEQAKEATFHQENQLASLINQLSNKNKFAKYTTDAVLPFKKTPMNIAKLGIEYSPVGLVKSAVYDTAQLRKGNITVNKYIDNISKGLTGTGIALVGFALANAGILKASGSDDKDKASYDEAQGNQTYSIKIGENTYSLDWIAPSGIPLFLGAEIYEIMQSKNESKSSSSDDDKAINQAINSAVNIMDGFTNAMNPMTEMSMLSGLTSALQSYQQGSSQMIANMITNAGKSYVNQYVPTALGQIAKTTDEYERSTSTTKTAPLSKAMESTKNQIMAKIPGLRQMLPTKTDTWGKDIKQPGNVVQRALENAVLPYTRKSISTNKVDTEITKVYKNTGESSVLPDNINKYLTIDKQKYIMTSEEYSKYKKQYGQSSYNLLNNLVNSSQYQNLTDSQKQFVIEKVYAYANEQIKVDYAKQNNLKYEQSTLSQVTGAIKKVNGNTSNYFEFLAKTQDLTKDSEKVKVLASSKYDEKTKKVIYENSLGKKDIKYDIIKDSFTENGLNTTKYLEYKSQEFTSEAKEDETIKGKTITGSKERKVFNYINAIKGATYTQKLILYALEYKPSSSSDKNIVKNYVNNLPKKTAEEKLEIMSKFKGVTVYKDGSYIY